MICRPVLPLRLFFALYHMFYSTRRLKTRCIVIAHNDGVYNKISRIINLKKNFLNCRLQPCADIQLNTWEPVREMWMLPVTINTSLDLCNYSINTALTVQNQTLFLTTMIKVLFINMSEVKLLFRIQRQSERHLLWLYHNFNSSVI